MRKVAISVTEPMLETEDSLAQQYVNRSLADPWLDLGVRLETSAAHNYFDHNYSEFDCRAAVVWRLPSWTVPTTDDMYVGLGVGSAVAGTWLEWTAVEGRRLAGLGGIDCSLVAVVVSHKCAAGRVLLLPIAARVIAVHPSACAMFEFSKLVLYSAGTGWLDTEL